MIEQLIPKAPRRKLQPSSAQLREQLAAAADRIIELEVENASLRERISAPRGLPSRLRAWIAEHT